MCYQTRQITTIKDLELRYNVTLSNASYGPLFDKPDYHLNGFSHPNMLLIPQQKPEVLAPGIWGIVPETKGQEDIKAYYKESIRYGAGLNAQSEKLFDHFIYKHSVMTKRCIIPVTGFYEPHTHLKTKYPVLIHRKDDGVFSLAGIYTIIGKYITFSILTKKASPYFERIHNIKKRQPVILKKSNERPWVAEELRQNDIQNILEDPYDDEQLEAYTISKDLYKPQVDSNHHTIAEPVSYKELGYTYL
jgi:putative SOS response-associated peptidase YedK